MIKIRYRDPHELSPGLHAHAERHGRRTTVYLLPGLSAAQRRAALRRLQISARRGYGPRLPALQLALALAVDRVRTNVGWAGAVFRSHPAGSTVPVMVVSAGAIAFLALSAVSIRVIHPPRVSGPPPFAGAAANLPLNTRTGTSSPSGTTDPGWAGRSRERARCPRPAYPAPPGTGPAPGMTPATDRTPERAPVTAESWPGAPTRRPRRTRRPPAPHPRPGPQRRTRGQVPVSAASAGHVGQHRQCLAHVGQHRQCLAHAERQQ